MAAALLVIAVFPAWRGEGIRVWALSAAAVFALLALVFPRLLGPLNRVWSALGILLGRVVNPIVLTALYLLVFFPVAMFLRARGNDSLRLKRRHTARTYWIEREGRNFEPASMRRQF